MAAQIANGGGRHACIPRRFCFSLSRRIYHLRKCALTTQGHIFIKPKQMQQTNYTHALKSRIWKVDECIRAASLQTGLATNTAWYLSHDAREQQFPAAADGKISDGTNLHSVWTRVAGTILMLGSSTKHQMIDYLISFQYVYSLGRVWRYINA